MTEKQAQLRQDDTNSVHGHAAGWSAFPASDFAQYAWQWSAWGPRGSNWGTAKSEAEAKERAKRAFEDLRQPYGGGGPR